MNAMYEFLNLPDAQSFDKAMTEPNPQTIIDLSKQQLEAELWLERFLGQLQEHIQQALVSHLEHHHQNTSQHLLISQVEAAILQTVVNQLRVALETGIVAIALPIANSDSHQLSQVTQAALHPELVFRICYIAPQKSRREVNQQAAIDLAAGGVLRFGLGETIRAADLQQLQSQEWQVAWPIPGRYGVLGWLLAISAQPPKSHPTSAKTQLRIPLMQRVVNQCASALQQIRLMQPECPHCQKLEFHNRELTRTNQLKSEFLANTSHEIRTPLSSILGFTHLLREQSYNPSNAKHQEYLNIILSSGQHLLGVINDILDLSKIEANQLDLQWETVNVADLCRSVLTLVKEKAYAKGLELRCNLDPDATTFIADALRLKQMLFNLLSNALKFTQRGTVGLQINLSGAFLHFTVWDTGTGISKEQQQQLFRPYAQLTNAAASPGEGTGLGLALTQKLAELHGGWVEVKSEINNGSQFTVVLPLIPEVASPHTSSSRTDSSHTDSSCVGVMAAESSRLESSPAVQISLGQESQSKSSQNSGNSSSGQGTTVSIKESSNPQPSANRSRKKQTSLMNKVATNELASAAIVPPSLPLRSLEVPKRAMELAKLAQIEEDSVHFPRHTTTVSHGQPGLKQTETLVPRPNHILLVEDNFHNAKLVITYLSKIGYEITWAKRSQEMWQALELALPTVILMDVQLPDSNGLTLIKELRSRDVYQRVPVIVQTAMAMNGDRQICLESGANDYISKPIDLKVLGQLVKKWVESLSVN